MLLGLGTAPLRLTYRIDSIRAAYAALLISHTNWCELSAPLPTFATVGLLDTGHDRQPYRCVGQPLTRFLVGLGRTNPIGDDLCRRYRPEEDRRSTQLPRKREREAPSTPRWSTGTAVEPCKHSLWISIENASAAALFDSSPTVKQDRYRATTQTPAIPGTCRCAISRGAQRNAFGALRQRLRCARRFCEFVASEVYVRLQCGCTCAGDRHQHDAGTASGDAVR